MSNSGLPVAATVWPGTRIEEAIPRKIILAKLVGRPIMFDFNGVTLITEGHSNPDIVLRTYWSMKIRRSEL